MTDDRLVIRVFECEDCGTERGGATFTDGPQQQELWCSVCVGETDHTRTGHVDGGAAS